MRISYEWLSSLIDLPAAPQTLVDEFIRTGTEVEAVETIGADITHVVTSQVVSKVPHPDSDHMFVCMMDVGTYNTDEAGNPALLQVVCGAQNFNEGDKTVTALVGATLPGNVHIKEGKLRGVKSCGMNCSESELGLASESAGIMILPPDAPVGVDFCTWKNLSDTVIDCEITPNRPDCLSMEGMAYEVSAMLNEPVHITHPQLKTTSSEKTSDIVDVTIADESLCSRYTARVIRNVTIAPSPEWLRRRLIAAGTRPINNVVDITNYVLYLTGHPLHAFDLSKINCGDDGKRHIVVRAAHDGEKLTLLDESERTLTSDMIVISDGDERAVCLAGVMGAQNSEIDENTCDVLLESAAFNAGHVSRTSRNLDLISEASIRYERQVNPSSCDIASEIACALFEECAGAQVSCGLVDVYPTPEAPRVIDLRPQRVCALAGADIPRAFMCERLSRLGCSVVDDGAGSGADAVDGGVLHVTVPPTRFDLTREIDLVEEVVRLWGEGDIAATLPAAKNHAGGLTPQQQLKRTIGRVLRAQGLSETVTYNFADPRDLAQLGMSEEGKGVPVRIMRPLVADQSEMRRDIIPGLLRAVAYNIDHGVANVHLYEIGRVFYGHEHKSLPRETRMVAAVMSGAWDDKSWCSAPSAFDFFDAKGIVEQLLRALRIEKVRFQPADPDTCGWLQPGNAAQVLIGGQPAGWVGAIHPLSLQKFGVDTPVFAFELSFDELVRNAHKELAYTEVPTLPGVSLDLAIVVPEELSYESIMQRIRSAGGKLLSEVRLFDMYRDDVRVGVGKKSMAFALTYRADDHTLTSQEVDKAHKKLIEKISRSCKAEIRS